MTPDLFPGTKPPRQRPRVLMHVTDATFDDDSGKPICVMTCNRCGTNSDWLIFDTITKVKKGVPCEVCNKKGDEK